MYLLKKILHPLRNTQLLQIFTGIVFAFGSLVSADARAEIISLRATLDGNQEITIPTNIVPTGSLGSGSGTFTFDTDTLILTWNITFENITDIFAHLHDETSNVAFSLGAGSPKIGQGTLTPIQADNLLANNYYVNIHTEAFLQGEIFGMVIVEPAPKITGVWPADGPPGTFVFVFGSNFTPGDTVRVNGILAPISQVLDDTFLVLSLPAGDTTGPVTVTSPAGTGTSSTIFGNPLIGLGITGIWPSEGPVGTIVFLFGGSFEPTTSVAVNAVTSFAVQVLDSDILLFFVPVGATTGLVSVTTSTGTAASLENFTVK